MKVRLATDEDIMKMSAISVPGRLAKKLGEHQRLPGQSLERDPMKTDKEVIQTALAPFMPSNECPTFLDLEAAQDTDWFDPPTEESPADNDEQASEIPSSDT